MLIAKSGNANEFCSSLLSDAKLVCILLPNRGISTAVDLHFGKKADCYLAGVSEYPTVRGRRPAVPFGNMRSPCRSMICLVLRDSKGNRAILVMRGRTGCRRDRRGIPRSPRSGHALRSVSWVGRMPGSWYSNCRASGSSDLPAARRFEFWIGSASKFSQFDGACRPALRVGW